MPSRRGQIAMTPEEVAGYLAEREILIVATQGPRGWPHVTALWYVVRDGEPWIFTYAHSQKVRNLERDPRATLLLESGHAYHEMRGLMLEARAEIRRDEATVSDVAEELFRRYASFSAEAFDEPTRVAVRAALPKRSAVRFSIERVVSWDHAKLGGLY